MFTVQFLKILPFGQDFPFCKSSSHILQDYVQEPFLKLIQVHRSRAHKVKVKLTPKTIQ